MVVISCATQSENGHNSVWEFSASWQNFAQQAGYEGAGWSVGRGSPPDFVPFGCVLTHGGSIIALVRLKLGPEPLPGMEEDIILHTPAEYKKPFSLHP
jgi:hypothetical protein